MVEIVRFIPVVFEKQICKGGNEGGCGFSYKMRKGGCFGGQFGLRTRGTTKREWR